VASPRRSPSFLFHSIGLVAALCCACAPGRDAGGSGRGAPPVSVVDDWGRTVRLAGPAHRIVSLAPASTELVFALGLGGRLVGRTTWCDYPPAARDVPDVGNGIAPSVEAVAARRPDLVLLYASEADRAALGSLTRIGIPVAVLRLDRARDLARDARLVATLAGEPAAGDSLADAFAAALAAATRPAPARPVRVYVDVQSDPPITVGRGSYLTEIIAAAGGRNIFDDIGGGSGPVSLEAVAQRDPDVVVVLASDTTAAPALERGAGWGAVAAVRAGRVLVLDGSLYGHPSPRMPAAVRALAANLARVSAGRGGP